MPSLPPEMIVVLAPFAQLFSERVWEQAQVLVLGAMLAPGKRTVSNCLRVMGLAWEAHFTNYHRVLIRATWSALQASKILLGLLVRGVVPPGATLVFGADDTIERRSGRQIKAKGRSPLRKRELIWGWKPNASGLTKLSPGRRRSCWACSPW